MFKGTRNQYRHVWTVEIVSLAPLGEVPSFVPGMWSWNTGRCVPDSPLSSLHFFLEWSNSLICVRVWLVPACNCLLWHELPGLASLGICSSEEEWEEWQDILFPEECLTCEFFRQLWLIPSTCQDIFFDNTSEPLRLTSSSRKSSCYVRLMQSTLASFNSSAYRTPVFLSLGEPLAFFRNHKTYAVTRSNVRREENLSDSMKDFVLSTEFTFITEKTLSSSCTFSALFRSADHWNSG